MPRLSVWTIRLSLVYLLLGFTLGGLLLADKGLPFSSRLWDWLPAHIELLLIGWTVQFVIGVAFWILPRFSRAPRRGNEQLAWLSVILLNLGICVAGFPPLLSSSKWLVLFGIAIQALAAFTFAWYAWPRIKPAGA